jgi:hypothetical protein
MEQVAKFDPAGYWKALGIGVTKGGAGSGNFGHAGRPGEVGGSSGGGGAAAGGSRESHARIEAHGTSHARVHEAARYGKLEHTTIMRAPSQSGAGKNSVHIEHHYGRGTQAEARAHVRVHQEGGRNVAHIAVKVPAGREKHGENIRRHLEAQYRSQGYKISRGGGTRTPKG